MFSFLFSVCAFGLYENETTCSPCVKLISGSGGENLIDGDSSTCSPVPFRTNRTVSRHYELGIHGHCTRPEIAVLVTGENSTTCDELRGAVFMEKPSDCGEGNPHYGICDVINEKQSNGKRMCAMRCKCAESVDKCLIHIFSGITPKDMRICDIKADRHFN